MGISWDEVEEAAEDRRSWRNHVAQCVFDAGWTKYQPFIISTLAIARKMFCEQMQDTLNKDDTRRRPYTLEK